LRKRKHKMQVFIHRENASVPWGFQLKGGAEFNAPLTVFKVNYSTKKN
jgi:hypothetical protein